MERKLSIQHVVYSGMGGHGNVFFSMVDADKEKFADYSVLFSGIEPVKEEYITKCKERNILYSSVLKIAGLHFRSFYIIYKAMRKHRPDIVFLHTPTNILPAIFYRFSRLFRAKVFVRETQPNHLKSFNEWMGSYIGMMFSNRVFFLSAQSRDDFKKKLGFFFSKRKTRIVPNGIDLSVFHPANQIHAEGKKVLLGMQARLSETKDHNTLLNAFALLKDKPYFDKLELQLAGDGVMRGELELLAEKLGIADRVKFLGMLKEQELSGFLQTLDIYIHASTGETMSTSIMQVMGCRLPVIASDVKGINNMVSHGKTGLLVKVQDAAAMVKAIDYVYMNPVFRKELAENGFEYAQEHFSNTRMWRDYKKEFEHYRQKK